MCAFNKPRRETTPRRSRLVSSPALPDRLRAKRFVHEMEEGSSAMTACLFICEVSFVAPATGVDNVTSNRHVSADLSQRENRIKDTLPGRG